MSLLVASGGPALACIAIDDPLGISICLDDTPWALREEQQDDFLFYHTANGYAANVTILDGGTDDGLESDRAARMMAASDSQQLEAFTILTHGKLPSGNFLYAARGSINSRSYVYTNTVSVGTSRTVRVSTWRIGDALSDEDRAVHIAFGNLLVVNP